MKLHGRAVHGRTFAIVVTLTLIVACGAESVRLGANATDPLTSRLDPARGAVLPIGAMPTLLDQCSRPVPRNVSGYWAPDTVMIAALDAALGPALADALARAEAHLDGQALTPLDYYRQYGGILIRGGERQVYVNGVHESQVESTAEWLEEMRDRPQDLTGFPAGYRHSGWWRGVSTTVCDGGWQFFGAVFDPASGRLSRIAFNRGP